MEEEELADSWRRVQDEMVSETPDDGSWVSTPGPYQDLVKSLCAADPGLLKRDSGAIKRQAPWPTPNRRVLALDVQADGKVSSPVVFNLDQAQNLGSYLTERTLPDLRTIYILEGLSPDFIAVLGEHFRLHPSVFVDHQRVSVSAVHHRGDENLLPTAGRDHVTFRFSELYTLPSTIETKAGIYCPDTGRYVGVTRTYGELSDAAALGRKCSFWSASREGPAGPGWDGKLFLWCWCWWWWIDLAGSD